MSDYSLFSGIVDQTRSTRINFKKSRKFLATRDQSWRTKEKGLAKVLVPNGCDRSVVCVGSKFLYRVESITSCK